MNMKEFEASLRGALARDEEWLKKIQQMVRRLSRRNADMKIIDPLIEIGQILIKQIKAYEKILKQFTKR